MKPSSSMQNQSASKIFSAVFLLIFCVMGMNAMGMTVEVKNHLGSPTIMIDGKPQTPMVLWAFSRGQEGPKSMMGSQILLANKAGVHLFSTEMDMPWPKPGEAPDFTVIDSAFEKMIAMDPKILVIPRFYPMPPQWWLDAHPGSEMMFSKPGFKGHNSVASDVWLKEAIQHMKVFVRHLEDKYNDHVIAYHIGVQENGEWFYWKSQEGIYNGFEEAYRTGFANWVKKKYKTEEKLRKAWHQPEITFASIKVPSAEERKTGKLGLFYDPKSQYNLIDFAEYQNVVNSDAILALAHAVKEETQGKKLTVFFYGYHFELPDHQHGHMGLGRVLRSKDVDILCSPLSYAWRGPGGVIPMMSPVDSIRQAGKLWLNEDDTRTYKSSTTTIATSAPGWVQATPKDTLRAHQRQFGHILPRRLATWYMDLGNEGWVNGEDIWQNLGELKKIYDREMQKPATWNPEVAVVVDERSTFYGKEALVDLIYYFRNQYWRMGTNFKILLLEDVLAGRAKLPKVTLFLECIHVNPADRVKLKEMTKGKTAVWFYGSGYINGKSASTDNMRALTGFSFQEKEKGSATMLLDLDKPLTNGLTNPDFTPNILHELTPRWSINADKNVKTFAKFSDGDIAAASRETEGGGRSIYIGTFGCPTRVIKNILKEAGVWLYMDSEDMVDTDGHFLSVTAETAGPKTILVPKGMNLYHEGDSKSLELKNGQFTEPFELGEVRFYRLEAKVK